MGRFSHTGTHTYAHRCARTNAIKYVQHGIYVNINLKYCSRLSRHVQILLYIYIIHFFILYNKHIINSFLDIIYIYTHKTHTYIYIFIIHQ